MLKKKTAKVPIKAPTKATAKALIKAPAKKVLRDDATCIGDEKRREESC